MIQVKTRTVIAPGLLPKIAATVFVTLTLTFLSVPYVLTRHPGESLPVPIVATSQPTR
jgi:hypothetical protein